MAESLFSESWYRVEAIRFKLRNHADIHRHEYRGELWYVLQDHVSGQFHRFTPEAYQIIGRLDGSRSLQQVWDAVCLRLDENMPTQDELITLVSKLYRANLLKADIAPDIDDLNSRHKTIRRNKFLQRIKSPLGIRVPLFDPDRFLNKTWRYVSPLFSHWGGIVWCGVIAYALLLVGINWAALSSNTSDRVLALENILLMALVYPVVKAIHELGHAYVLKKWGAEVHEIGIMFLVFFPVPEVEASAATAFPDKRQRMLVAAIGVMVEAFMAALAMIVWSFAEPGVVRTLAFNVMLISGVSTLLFNGNPLLKFDAYYALADYLEIPNLAARSNQYIGYLLKRRVFRIPNVYSPAASVREGCWLAFYSVASYCYRFFVMLAIALYIASEFFVLGALIAAWSIYMSLIQPLVKVLLTPFNDAQLKQKQSRVLSLGFGFFALLLLLLVFVKVPYATQTQGVFLASELAYVRAENSGFVRSVVATPGARVVRGAVLLQMEDADLQAEIAILNEQVIEARERYQASIADISRAEIFKRELDYLVQELARATERQTALTVTAAQAGIFDLPDARSIIGRFVHQGELMGHVVDYDAVNVTTLVSEDAIEKVINNTRAIEVRLVSQPDTVYPATMRRTVPASSTQLPSAVLSVDGGGNIAADPKAVNANESFERYFQVEIAVPDAPKSRLEERVYVLFKHDPEPLIYRGYRAVRRVFLSQLNV